MLTNSLKISDTSKGAFFELKFFQCNQKIWQNYCRANISSVSDPLTCCLSISALTPCLLSISVTRLVVYLFSLSFFSKYSKFM